MAYALDHVADKNGADMHRYSKLYEVPDFVKSASYKSNWKPENLSPTCIRRPPYKTIPLPQRRLDVALLPLLHGEEGGVTP